jgi:hypothetical protein
LPFPSTVPHQVRHDYNDLLHEGQEVVLTLVDKGILDERGRGFNEAAEEDELENVLKVRVLAGCKCDCAHAEYRGVGPYTGRRGAGAEGSGDEQENEEHGEDGASDHSADDEQGSRAMGQIQRRSGGASREQHWVILVIAPIQQLSSCQGRMLATMPRSNPTCSSAFMSEVHLVTW